MTQKPPTGSPISNQVSVVLLTTILLFFLVAFAGKAVEEYRLRRELERMNQEINRLNEERVALERTAVFMESSAYAERELKKWGKVRPGETWVAPIATLVTPAVPSQVTPAPIATPERYAQDDGREPPYWDEWFKLISRP